MACSLACRISPQNHPLWDKDKLAEAAAIDSNERFIPVFTVTHSSTSSLAITPPVGSILSSVARYLENNLQWIFKTVLDFGPSLAPTSALIIIPHYGGLYKKPLKAWFSNVYWSKSHIEYYNFC